MRPFGDAAKRLFLLVSLPPCLLVWFSAGAPALAQTPPPRTILIVVDGLSADALHSPALPHLAALVRSSSIGLMSTPVAGAKTDTAAALVMALGTIAPAEPTDDAIFHSRSEMVENAPAGVVFLRRMDLDADLFASQEQLHRHLGAPPDVLVHLGEASLMRRGLHERLVGAILAESGSGGQLTLYGAGGSSTAWRRAALLMMGPVGLATCAPPESDPTTLARQVATASGNALVAFGGAQAVQRLDAFLGALSGAQPQPRILVVSPHPPPTARGEWDRLTAVVLAGPGIPHGLLTSATTRTEGLVANLDVAPTLLSWVGARVPGTMTGHIISTSPSSAPLESVLYADRRVRLNYRALDPVFVLLGVAAGLIGFGGLAAVWMGSASARWLGFGILALMNMPLAMLLIPPFVRTVAEQGAWTVALMVALAAMESVVGRVAGRTQAPLLALAILTCLVVLADTLLGGHLMRWSLFGADPLSGIRFYGIGNEYMGAIIGLTLLWAFLANAPAALAGGAFLVVTFILGYPGLGAKAGGLVTAGAAFGAGWMILSGRRARWWSVALWALGGLALAFALALLDRTEAGTSHFGGALRGAQAAGYRSLLEIVVRKIAMNLRITLHPGVLAVLAGYAVAVWLAGGALRSRVAELAARNPGWARGLPAAGWGALVAFLFNDAGVVAAVFILAAFIGAGLYLLFTEKTNEPQKRHDPQMTQTRRR